MKKTILLTSSIGIISWTLQHIIEEVYFLLFDKYPVYIILRSLTFVNTDFNFLYFVEIPNILISGIVITYIYYSASRRLRLRVGDD